MKEIIICTAAAVAIIAGGIYIVEHVHCFNFFGLAQGCVIGK